MDEPDPVAAAAVGAPGASTGAACSLTLCAQLLTIHMLCPLPL